MHSNQPILIVDNSADDVELFRIGLAELDLPHPIEVCRDGAQALDYLLRRGAHAGRTGPLPCVVLMDLKMPRMDGIEALRRIRGEAELRAVPVVLLTSSHHDRDVAAAYEAGANGFVVKPVAFEALLACARGIGEYWGRINSPWQPRTGGN